MMKPETSCLNTRAIIDYLERRSIDPHPYLKNLDPEIDLLDDPYTYLRDRNNWIATSVVIKLFTKLRKELSDEQLPFKVGYETVTHKQYGYVQNIFMRLFATPVQGLKKAQEINDRFNRTKTIELSEATRGRATVRLIWFPEPEFSKDLCLYNQGIYTAIPIVWGLEPASLTETSCAFEGGNVCEYRLRWQPAHRFMGIFGRWLIPRSLFEATVRETEADKQLLTQKYREVHNLSLNLRKKIQELETLHESGRAIVSILDRNELLEVIMRLITSSLGYDRAMIMLADQKKESLCMAAASGVSEELSQKFHNYRVPISRISNILVRSFVSGNPILVDDVAAHHLNPNNPILQALSPKSFVVVPLISRGKVIGVMAADRINAPSTITPEELDYLVGFSNHMAVALENSRLYQNLEETYLDAIQSLAEALEVKDPYTRGHSERVSIYSERIAQILNWTEPQKRNLKLACLIHDIGKIGVPEAILHKPDRLTTTERELIEEHPLIGEIIIQPLRGLEEIRSIVRHHHERFDGYGYPDRLKGEKIPLEARIMAIADCFDAMTTRRPYRDPFPEPVVIQELEENRGTQFDPALVDVFLEFLQTKPRGPEPLWPAT